ncbi:MAG: LpxL/LpxP family Kdo(2)-lipid IV(A) lauroyl/palmitoleoyl acyltransferase [Gammaproteobacteria bacterium]|nr:LpxL/LpxP family Kdo(2)-lipid IV(A) lauroyl/palmitoleoyl acyltransferase [Gammaproteobacteria bacterium]
MNNSRTPLYHFIGPKYWPLWLGLALMGLVSLLPSAMAMRVGRGLGWIMYRVLPKRRQVAERNIELAYPELESGQRQQLVKDIFASLGKSVIETTWCWWASDRRVRSLQRIEGLEHLEQAKARGKGVILLSGHFTMLELTGRMALKGRSDAFGMYRRHRNPLFQELMLRGRERTGHLIDKQEVRGMIRVLKKGDIVWYAPDQAFRGKMSTMADFFGVPCPTNTATSRLAKITGAAVVPFLSQRLPDNNGYLVKLFPPLDNFPTDDVQADTQRVNDLIESWVRQAPDQYLWVHRRFKPEREGMESLYKVNPHKRRPRQ